MSPQWCSAHTSRRNSAPCSSSCVGSSEDSSQCCCEKPTENTKFVLVCVCFVLTVFWRVFLRKPYYMYKVLFGRPYHPKCFWAIFQLLVSVLLYFKKWNNKNYSEEKVRWFFLVITIACTIEYFEILTLKTLKCEITLISNLDSKVVKLWLSKFLRFRSLIDQGFD